MDKAFDTNLLEWYRFQPAATFDDPFVDASIMSAEDVLDELIVDIPPP